MPHGHHIYANASDMSKAKFCTHPQSDHAIPHWKCVLRCCSECPYINLPDQENNTNMKKQHPRLGFILITSLQVVLLVVKFN